MSGYGRPDPPQPSNWEIDQSHHESSSERHRPNYVIGGAVVMRIGQAILVEQDYERKRLFKD